MATTSNDSYLKDVLDSLTPSTAISAALVGGKVRVQKDRCIPAGVGDAASTFTTGIVLPKGALVLFSIVYPVDSSDATDEGNAMANAVTLEIGLMAGATEAADPDALGDVTTLAAATPKVPQIITPSYDGTVYTNCITPLREARQVYITTGGAALVATEGFIIMVFYSVE